MNVVRMSHFSKAASPLDAEAYCEIAIAQHATKRGRRHNRSGLLLLLCEHKKIKRLLQLKQSMKQGQLFAEYLLILIMHPNGILIEVCNEAGYESENSDEEAW